MPFNSNKGLTNKVKGTSKLSDKKKRQFRHVFNKCHADKGDDSSCYAQAWGVVNRSASISKIAKGILRVARLLCQNK